MPLTRRHLFLFALILLLFFAAAQSSMAETEDTDSAGPIEITDATGHTATLPHPPQRIAIAGKATIMLQNAAFLFKAAEDRVVALENRRQSALRFLPLVDPEISEKTFFAVNAGPEQIAAVKPDLVLMKNFMARSLGAPLKKLEIPVLYLNLETPESFYRDIRTLGAVFGDPQRAETIIRFYKSRLTRVRRRVSEISEKPDVLLLEYSKSGGSAALYAPPPSWLQTRLVELAGGRPVWKAISVSRGWCIVTVEQIAAWDPDQIYLIDYGGKAAEAVADLQKDPLWTGLRAVQNQELHAFAFDFYSWDQPGTRWILGLQWLASRIHPELKEALNIENAIREFYTTLYRMNPQAIEQSVLPRLKGVLP